MCSIINIFPFSCCYDKHMVNPVVLQKEPEEKRNACTGVFRSDTCHHVIFMQLYVLLISSVQKVADDKAMKAKKGGGKGKKDDGPAQNGETKTNEVRGGESGIKTNE